MVAARAEVAGAAAMLPGAEANASDDASAATAACPTAVVAGGTCNYETTADYTRGPAGRPCFTTLAMRLS